jgi:hypothetical protein
MAGVVLINKEGKIWIDDLNIELNDRLMDHGVMYDKKLEANGITVYVELAQDVPANQD